MTSTFDITYIMEQNTNFARCLKKKPIYNYEIYNQLYDFGQIKNRYRSILSDFELLMALSSVNTGN